MKILAKTGSDDLATVYLAETENNQYIEFVESVQPPYPRDEKWVLIVSTLFGCPVGCGFCDAGGWYKGRLSSDEIIEQIEYMIVGRYPNRKIPARKFKIQFARMGDPVFNDNVSDVLKKLPYLYDAPGLMPSISTVAPNRCGEFLEKILEIKDNLYSNGRFLLQFSIHSTDKEVRNRLIPIKKWDFSQIAEFGERFYRQGDRKIALNFALAENSPLDVNILKEYFNPDIFLLKLTPVNPTVTAGMNSLYNGLTEDSTRAMTILESLKEVYEVIISIGELEENKIGSNCGQLVRRYMETDIDNFDKEQLEAYEYKVVSF
jgi:23S rRNA (adenine2503-C2)-methyltransferase